MKHAAMPRHGTGLAWRSLAVGNQWERRRDTQRRGKREGGGKWEGQLDVSSGRISSALFFKKLSRETKTRTPSSCIVPYSVDMRFRCGDGFFSRTQLACGGYVSCVPNVYHPFCVPPTNL